MKNKLFIPFVLFLFVCFTVSVQAQNKVSNVDGVSYDALELRNIGPALTSGRISDIDIHPEDENIWYVAVGSGGVWKTINAGTTWEPIFDEQGSYSIGTVKIDPNNPHTIWVGTGEDVGGRHVGFGDGVYKSTDGGITWENKGIENSEHISRIIIHPNDPDIVWVSAQGPLWSSGGDRGLYKSNDGGETWEKKLGDNEWTGVTDIVIDPRDPDIMYAATWQRHRNVAAYMGGGPNTGIYKSTNGGESWIEIEKGLPTANMGKIGLAISPQDPDIVYAVIELDRRKGGLYMSDNRGEFWRKMSDAVSGGTGAHYYQELYASPHHFGTIYIMDYSTQVSNDHGETFNRIQDQAKHSDDHALAFRKDDPDYLLMGTDGGLYESFDLANSWHFIDNMPITQFYKVSVDDAKPFYNVYGGTQDNGSQGGPSRTTSKDGILNRDWEKTFSFDGHESATEPGNPDIIYATTQQGGLHRIDKTIGEGVYIEPQPDQGEDFERFNWDAPLEVSFHNPTRLYFASQRLWRSDNRGDSWTPISPDLTRNQERITLPIMGRTQSWDNAWDVGAMSNYNTITSIGESPIDEDLLYVGTDDGIIQVTQDGGENWNKFELSNINGVPGTAFVNDIKADHFDVNTVYVALDNHKYGDFNPYIIKSTDRGNTWSLISEELPDRHLVWRVVQDHNKKDLLFAATEFGIFFTPDGGNDWIELEGGVPTISFRDIVIQRDHNDLVAASFGRGIFILDDYTPLRNIDVETLNKEGVLFPTRDAFWYVEEYFAEGSGVSSSDGDNSYKADNPPFGAVFTYYLKDGYQSLEHQRRERENEVEAENNIPFPGWDQLENEIREQEPKIIITIKSGDGDVVRKIEGPATEGFHRINWDLKHASKDVIKLDKDAEGGILFNFFADNLMVMPGTYEAELSKVVRGEVTELGESVSFNVVPLKDRTLERKSSDVFRDFYQKIISLHQDLTKTSEMLQKQLEKINALQTGLFRSDTDQPELVERINKVRLALLDIQEELSGSEAKNEIGERNNPTPMNRLIVGYRGLRNSYGPTETHFKTIDNGIYELNQIKDNLTDLIRDEVTEIEKLVENAGSPPIGN